MNKLMNFVWFVLLSMATLVYGAGGVLPGSGTEADPYLIEDMADFDVFCDESKAGVFWVKGVYTKLVCNVDLSGRVYEECLIAHAAYSKFGGIEYIDGYLGVFDGGGSTISNLTISCTDYLDFCCLFGVVGSYPSTGELVGEVKNLILLKCNISGDSAAASGIVGENCGTISNCVVSGEMTGGTVGGLVGVNDGIVRNCYSSGVATGVYNQLNGGAYGYNGGVGGLVGSNYGEISCSFSTVDVTGGEHLVGGLAAGNWGRILDCYSTGNVYSEEAYVGGLVGANTGYIKHCYSTGAVGSGLTAVEGGFVGVSDSSPYRCYWDVETSGMNNSDGGERKTTLQMQSMNTFLNAGWDFVGEGANGTEGLWHMPYEATGYPMLWWQKDILGDIAGGYGVDMEDAAEISRGWQVEFGLADLGVLAENWLVGVGLSN